MTLPFKRHEIIQQLDNDIAKAIMQLEGQKKIQLTLGEIVESCSDVIIKRFIQKDSRKEDKWSKITFSTIKTTYDGTKWVKSWSVVKNSDVDNRP